MTIGRSLSPRLSRPVGRDAARRRQETELLSDLASELPLQSSEVEHVTQMKALKLAIQFSRLHQVLKLGGPGALYKLNSILLTQDLQAASMAH